MARSPRHSKLETRTARLKLPARKKPYAGPALSKGLTLLYRRNRGNGTWTLKARAEAGTYWTARVAEADDYAEANGDAILNFFQAQQVARKIAGEGADRSAPPTLAMVLDAYAVDLKARGASLQNVGMPRNKLPASMLAKPVPLIQPGDFRSWRDEIAGNGLAPASVNRVLRALRAALDLAGKSDPRIASHQHAWKHGLALLPNAERARNAILGDDEVRAVVAAAYRHNASLGLFLDVAATTGARGGQITRLTVTDFIDDAVRPKLLMPKSGKGGGLNRAGRKSERFPVPITPALAAKLRQAAHGRDGDAPLLLTAFGNAWGRDPLAKHRTTIAAIMADAGLDPATTPIALRHSSIVRMLLRNVPVRVTASLHDTSVAMIEANYSKHIAGVADEIARAALLQSEPPAGANIVALVR
jgi:integrase